MRKTIKHLIIFQAYSLSVIGAHISKIEKCMWALIANLIIWREHSHTVVSLHGFKRWKVHMSINCASDYLQGALTACYWCAYFKTRKCMWASIVHLIIYRAYSHTVIGLHDFKGGKLMWVSIVCLIIFRAYSHPIISAHVSRSAKFKWASIVLLIIFWAYSQAVINSHSFEKWKVHARKDYTSNYLPGILTACYWFTRFWNAKSAGEH